MMRPLVLGSICLMIMACSPKQKEEVATVVEPMGFSIQDYGKLVEVTPEVAEELSTWAEYNAYMESFAVLERATNSEDVKLAVDDLIEKEKEWALSDYPEAFDRVQLKSRQRVLRTFLFKLRANLLDNRKIDAAMQQFILASNALRSQYNSLSGETFDAKLILDED